MDDYSKLAAEIKEVKRLLKTLDDYTMQAVKDANDDIIAGKNAMKGIDKRVGELEKKSKR